MADHHLTLFQPGEGGKVCPPFYNIHPITKDIRKYFQGHPFIHYEYVQLFGNYVVYLQSAVSYYLLMVQYGSFKNKTNLSNVVNNCKITTIIPSRVHGKITKVTINERCKGCLGSFRISKLLFSSI